MGLLIQFNEDQWAQSDGQTTPPGSGGTVNGHPVDMVRFVGGEAPTIFRAAVATNHVGVLNVEQSSDGVDWYVDTAATAANVAGKVSVVSSNIVMRYVRAQFVNGATACTTFAFTSTLVG